MTEIADGSSGVAPSAAQAPGDGAVTHTIPEDPSVRGRRVLVAEDDPVVRSFVRLALGQDGLDVLEARDGREAAELARAQRVDLVITDLWMPVMNGVELIETLATQGCQVRVCVLSGHLTASSTDRLARLGVFRVLSKPVDVGELRLTVREALLAPPSAARRGHPPESRATILVADDDDGVRALLRDCLAREGYRVEEASDGEEAVEKALALDLSLILMDLNMPRMSGGEAVATLRRASRDCFVICMTGESSQQEMDAAVARGAWGCIRKPLDLEKLLGELRRLDLIARHRRALAERERELLARERRAGLVARTRKWFAAQEHRYGRRFRWMLALAVIAVVALAAAVPVLSLWLQRASSAAASVANKIESAADAAARIEGYLQRDEERELRAHPRP